MSQEVNKDTESVQEEVKKTDRDMVNEVASKKAMGWMLESILFGAFAKNDKNDFTDEERTALKNYTDALQGMLETFAKGGN